MALGRNPKHVVVVVF